jgi:hypothetical protein
MKTREERIKEWLLDNKPAQSFKYGVQGHFCRVVNEAVKEERAIIKAAQQRYNEKYDALGGDDYNKLKETCIDAWTRHNYKEFNNGRYYLNEDVAEAEKAVDKEEKGDNII